MPLPHSYFLELAETVSYAAHDDPNNRQIGCVIVGPEDQILSTGFNGLPRGVQAWHMNKDFYIEHAERNAIYNAARHGITLRNCRMYLVGGLMPCADCARAIIQSGITQVYVGLTGDPGRWKESIESGQDMFAQAGLEFVEYYVFEAKDNDS